MTNLGREEASDSDAGREADGDGHGGDTQGHVVSRAEVQGNEGQPDHTSCVHCKTLDERKEMFIGTIENV